MNNQLQSDYRNYTIILIVLSTVVRSILGGMVELNNDEVYYWTYAKDLQWNYFDHPPMVAVCIRFFTAGLQWNQEIFIRMASIIGSTISTWLIFLSGKTLKNERTGWIAAVLFTGSFFSSVIAGMLILPDSPQMVFWMLSLFLMLRINRSVSKKEINILLLLLGVSIGLCILSKVHGIFCWLGFGAYILFRKRALLKSPFLYIAVLITAAMLIPSVLWTLNAKMSTVDYHGSRIMIRHFQFDSFLRELLGSFAYNNPVNVVLLVISLFAIRKQPASLALVLWLGLPLIGTVLFLSLFNDTLPHWSGPAYTTLILVTAWWLSEEPFLKTQRLLKASVTLCAGALILATAIINYWPGTLGKKTVPDYGKHDITLDMSGWASFGKQFSAFRKRDNFNTRFIFSNYWFPAAHLDFYVARPLGMHVKAVGNVNDIHHFAWLNAKLPQLKEGEDAYYITISNFNDPVPDEIIRSFKSVSEPVTLSGFRSGSLDRYFYVYRLNGYQPGAFVGQ
ncbi:MAG: ArnT family glycosyltransferase [Pseudobacter sp.]|uniref:ArnT family glycosyltransferase n=1 Tax=Pseudobacter sp. TaxID=2045420 RepID=UPI003F7EDD1C